MLKKVMSIVLLTIVFSFAAFADDGNTPIGGKCQTGCFAGNPAGSATAKDGYVLALIKDFLRNLLG